MAMLSTSKSEKSQVPNEQLTKPRPWPSPSPALSVLAVLAILYTLYLAAGFLIPITAAIVLNFVLSPIPRLFARYRVPEALSASLIVPSFFVLVLGGAYSLAGPAQDWMARIPEITREVKVKLMDFKASVAQVQEASEQVENVASVGDESSKGPEVRVKTPSLLERLFGTLQEIGIQIGVTLVLLFFLLASGQMFKEKLVSVVPRLQDKKRAILITKQIEKDVSNYLFTITMINVGLGFTIGVGLHLIGLPNAIMWGVMAMLLNFVPYLGAIFGMAVVALVGLITFDSLPQALLAPAIYAGVNVIESQIVTPTVLGRRLTLNAVVVFISVVFWGWIWGVPGAFMAVPLLVTLKVLCDHIERLATIGEFLSGRQSSEP
jgi:predicted PurR-regulated permease PerM